MTKHMMVSHLWCFAFLVFILIQTNKINAQKIKEKDRSKIGNLFRFGADLKIMAADEIDDLIGQFRDLLGAGGGSFPTNLQQITETASTDIQNGNTASLEDLIKNPISPQTVSKKQVKQVVIVYEDGSVEPVSDASDNLLSLFTVAH